VTGPSGLRRFVPGSAPAPPPAAPSAPPPGPAAAPAERCEMCATDVPAEHGHVADLDNATLACVCRACYLLFTESGAGGGRYRGVPDRYLADPARPMAAAEWDSLQIPVGLAFFLRSSRSGETHAFYPSPAGATESTLDLAAWARLTAGYPLLGEAQPDTEAVLICRGDAGAEYYLVPIDACYELAGRMRLNWRGFDGGAQARAAIADFLADVRSRARDLAGQAGRRGGARA
jgi:Family of unknown function (DUF5947)